MKSVIGNWIGKQVHVVLRATMPTPLVGKVLALDESGILLEVAASGSRSFVPVTSILHVTLVDGA